MVEKLKRMVFEVVDCCKDISCILLIISGSVMGGTLAAWGGLFATILAPLGYSETEAGKIFIIST